MTRFSVIFTRLLAVLTVLAAAQWAIAADGDVIRSYLEITPANRADLVQLLDTMEAALSSENQQTVTDPVVVILHGDEAFSFLKKNYAANKEIADRAALLDAYKVIEVRMCETWMNDNDVSSEELLPYIDTVPYAPDEIRRLEAEGYQPFSAVKM